MNERRVVKNGPGTAVAAPDGPEADDCAFCLGRAAAHRGEDHTSNPFAAESLSEGSESSYETDYGLWSTGHWVGLREYEAGTASRATPTDGD